MDWAGSLWVVVKTGTEVSVTTEPAFLIVWHQLGKDDGVKSVLVDIPIGLADSAARECDEEAMVLLGNRRSTVFSIPREENDGSPGSQSTEQWLHTVRVLMFKMYELTTHFDFKVLLEIVISQKREEGGTVF